MMTVERETGWRLATGGWRGRNPGWRLATLLPGLLVALAGCGDSSGEGSAPPAVVDSSPGASDSAPEPVSQWSASYQALVLRMKASSDPSPKKIADLRAFIASVRAEEAKAGKSIPEAALAEQEARRLEATLAAEGEVEIAKLEAEVKKVLAAPDGDLSEAASLVADFPAAKYAGTPIGERYESLRARVERHQAALLSFEYRKARLGDDPVKNIALLEGVDPKFDDTTFYAKAQELIRENYGKYLERKKTEEAADAEALWEDVKLERLLSRLDESTASGIKDGVLSVGPNLPDQKDQGTCVLIGEEGWIDLEMHLEVQMKDGEMVQLGVRGYEKLNATGERVINFAAMVPLGGLEIADDGWHKLVIKIQGDAVEVDDATGKKSVRQDSLRDRPGPIGLRVLGEKAFIKVKNVSVKVRKALRSEQEKEPGGEKKKKAAKGAAKK